MNSLNLPSKLLVIAQSARMLVQLVVDAGFAAVAVDCFADLDTRALATETVKVDDLALETIQLFIEDLTLRHGLTHVVYGSGFEYDTDSLAYLERRLIVLGNSAAVFRCLQKQPAFFGQLRALAINFPETVFSVPTNHVDWLIKPRCGEGGFGIARVSGDAVDAERFYWQRRLNGEAYSVLFVATGGQVRVLGFNRQWVAGLAEQPYLFAGVANHADISQRIRELLVEWLDKLALVYVFKGLGSLDFIVHEGACYVLEINARIPASAQLYGASVFNLHCQACLGELGMLGDEKQARPAGFCTVFAKYELVVPAGINWPEWVVDRPASGVFVGKGAPVCSIIATENGAAQVESQLQHRQFIIDNLLHTGYLTHAIPR